MHDSELCTARGCTVGAGGLELPSSPALMDIWSGPMWYFFSVRWEHVVFTDTYSGPQPKQVLRYPHRPGWLSNHLRL